MFTNELAINRPKTEVFQYLGDVEKASNWYSAVTRVTALDDSKPGLGKHYLFERDLGGHRTVIEVEIAEWEPDRILALRSLSGPTPFAYRFTLKERAGATQLSLEGEISAEGLPGLLALAGPLAERAFSHGMRANLKALKTQLER
jgi:uncharacterized protein YndB with AHSA1/START domain